MGLLFPLTSAVRWDLLEITEDAFAKTHASDGAVATRLQLGTMAAALPYACSPISAIQKTMALQIGREPKASRGCRVPVSNGHPRANIAQEIQGCNLR